MDKNILAFVQHKSDCDHMQPMWHQGPCDCGLYAMLTNLRTVGLSTDVKSTISLLTLYTLLEVCPDLINDWLTTTKTTIPMELFLCKKCGFGLAEKKSDIQGWDGFCSNCGIIGQNQVGDLVFSVAK